MITVYIPDRGPQSASWSQLHGYLTVRTVQISDRCPVCCGPRGAAMLRHFAEDGRTFCASCWDNPCGHVDRYPDVLAEAALLARAGEVVPGA
jgi:hypothetical protein